MTNIDDAARTATCSHCGPVHIRHRGRNGTWRCGLDADNRSKLYKTAYRESRKTVMKKTCEICGTTDGLKFDHDHVTGRYRGTLCQTCNTGIGQFKDNQDLLKRAIKYLTRPADPKAPMFRRLR